MRTLLSAVAIGVQVTMILTLVGVSDGMLGDIAQQRRGTGADIFIRPPDSSILSLSAGTMPERIVDKVRQQPHITFATGSLFESVAPLDTVVGIRLEEFNQLSGGFRYIEGGQFQQPGDILLDQMEARSEHAHAGGTVTKGKTWHVTGIVESGKMSHMFADLATLQDQYGAPGKISVIWAKVDNPANVDAIIEQMKANGFKDYGVYSMDQMTSLLSADNIPILKKFTYVVIGIAVVVGFLVVFLSMYTAVLERTREIGILKALGASPQYILGMLLRETMLLAIAGAIAGILMSYGTRYLMDTFVPTMTTVIVVAWWKWAALIAISGSLIGALYPGMKAARQDAIEALSYD